LEQARVVLKSGNQVAFDALERNIRYFAHTIENERRFEEIESRLSAVEQKEKEPCVPSGQEEKLLKSKTR